MSSERERIVRLAALFAAGATAGSAVRVGIGDDAAVLAPPRSGELLVWTIDAQVEGTHWRRDWLVWRDVGWRSFMAAASDLAAMGASPVAALSALVLADDVDDAALEALATGQADAARALGTTVAGGNLARGTATSITTTLLGSAEHPVLRSGARVGDGVYLGGAVGLAAAGLAALEGGLDRDEPAVAACVAAWRRPHARIDLGLAIRATATAAVDVSDGLLADAGHLAEASGVGLVFEETALRCQTKGPLEAVARVLGRKDDGLRFVLGGGEDYALLVTSPVPMSGFVRVGSVVAGRPSLRIRRIDGTTEAVSALGFDHFASETAERAFPSGPSEA